MSIEGAIDGLGAGGLLRAGDERFPVVGLLEHALPEERHARCPDRAVLARALRPSWAQSEISSPMSATASTDPSVARRTSPWA